MTFPRTAAQGPATKPAEYPGIDNLAHYSEGIFVGYRYYDHFGQVPLFPFGYGLSYTSFSLGGLRVHGLGADRFRVTARLRNTGRRIGAEVVQLYVGFPVAAGEPPRQLKAFARASLRPGASRTITLALPRSSFSYFSQASHRFVVAPGRYRIYIGTSSRQLPLSGRIEVR